MLVSIFSQILISSALASGNLINTIDRLNDDLKRKSLIVNESFKESELLASGFELRTAGYLGWLFKKNSTAKIQSFYKLLDQNLGMLPNFIFGSESLGMRFNYAAIDDMELTKIWKAVKDNFT